jgi:hypothetical protein
MQLLFGCAMKGSMIFCQKNILEHSIEVPWGLFKEMITNAQGQSDIVIHQTYILNKVFTMPNGFLFTKC